MRAPLSLFLGLRYAITRRRRGFLSFISAVAMLGLALGTAVLIIVLSVLNGFERELRERVLGVVPQLLVAQGGGFSDWSTSAARIKQVAGVRAVAPLVGGAVLVATPTGVRAAELSGILPVAESKVSIVSRFVRGASLADLRPGEFGALIGARLADALKVRPGESVSVVLPQAAVTPLGVFPRQKRFRVLGLLSSGAEIDDHSIYIHLADAQRLYQLGSSVQSLRLRLDDLFAAPETARRVADGFSVPGVLDARSSESPLQTRDWTQTHGALYRAILLQRTTMLVLLSLVIAVAAFNVVASLVMIVTDKQGDIAILRSLGFATRSVMASFVWLGALVGLVGIGAGASVGVVFSLCVESMFGWLEARLHIHLLDQYFIHYLPSQLRWGDVVLVGSIALVLTLIASLYPAWRAARVLPAEVLRYE